MPLQKKIASLMLIAVVGASALFAADLTKDEQSWVAKASRETRNGWVYLHIEGQPFARGFQHGYLLAKEIAESLRVEKHMIWWDTGREWPYFVERTLKMFAPKIDPEFREEMEGIAAGARKAGVDVSYGDIVLLNASSEIMGYWYPSHQENSPPLKTGGCSAFIATGKATADGRIVMAHNTWSFFVPADTNVIIDLRPDKGSRILMQAFPAGIHSDTDFFICSSGLVGTETTIDYFKGFDPDGMPEFVRIRKAMQYARNLDEALKIMIDGNNGGYANTWLFGDVRSNEIARLELGLKFHSVERTRDGFYSGSNIT
ncbi:MAG: C45 family autoproteolytic acyltransferase/hydrolase, partial [Candidatus Aminicenantales bacterium]